jgi:hypothetical protein
MWEIFTAFTLALTLASILMWFSNLQPRQIQREFTWQDQNKNSLYNLSLKVEAVNSDPTISNSYIPSGDPGICFENGQKNIITGTEENSLIKDLNSLNTELYLILKASEEYRDYVQSSPSFEELATSLDDYITEIKNQHGANRLLIQKDIELKDYLSQLCQAKYDKELVDTSYFKDLRTLNNSSSFTNREMYIYTANIVENLLKELKEVNDPVSLETIVDSLNKAVTKMFTLELKSDTQQGRLETTNFAQKIKDYESWQKKFLIQNKNLSKKAVFIFEDSEIS